MKAAEDAKLPHDSMKAAEDVKLQSSPSMAATTELTPMASPVTHNTTAKPMVASMIRSSRLIGPIFSNRSAAALGASGVSLISGGDNCSHSTRCSCQSKQDCLSVTCNSHSLSLLVL